MTGGIFTACINSTDPLIPLLGPLWKTQCFSDLMVHYSRCDKYLWFRSASGMLVRRWHVTGISENTHNCTFQKRRSVPTVAKICPWNEATLCLILVYLMYVGHQTWIKKFNLEGYFWNSSNATILISTMKISCCFVKFYYYITTKHQYLHNSMDHLAALC